jgi:hypothetical protein
LRWVRHPVLDRRVTKLDALFATGPHCGNAGPSIES